METTITALTDDENLGQVLLTFDGAVFEVFGDGAFGTRLHTQLMVVEVDEPDKKGRIRVDVAPRRPGWNGVRLVLTPENWLKVAPLIGEVQRVLAAR